MDILDLVEEDLLENYGPDAAPKPVSSTNGGEYASPCPHPDCGGEDRFRIWPNHPKGPRFWCRGCNRYGNVIEYLKQFRRMSFHRAFRFVKSKGLELPKRGERSLRKPSDELRYPPIEWQRQAALFIKKAEECLWSSAGVEARSSLHKRGIRDEAIRTAHLGWNPADVYDSRANWGLDEVILETGHPKKILIPRGLVIPSYRFEWWCRKTIIRLRVRNPASHADPKYRLVAGSSTCPMILSNSGFLLNEYCVVVESELDGILLHQEAGDLTNIIALGSASTRPGPLSEELKRASLILVSLDNDEAGEKAFFDYWNVNFRKCSMWPVPASKGKDAAEAYQNGLDIRSWVYAGLEDDIKKSDALIKKMMEMMEMMETGKSDVDPPSVGTLDKPCEDDAEIM